MSPMTIVRHLSPPLPCLRDRSEHCVHGLARHRLTRHRASELQFVFFPKGVVFSRSRKVHEILCSGAALMGSKSSSFVASVATGEAGGRVVGTGVPSPRGNCPEKEADFCLSRKTCGIESKFKTFRPMPPLQAWQSNLTVELWMRSSKQNEK